MFLNTGYAFYFKNEYKSPNVKYCSINFFKVVNKFLIVIKISIYVVKYTLSKKKENKKKTIQSSFSTLKTDKKPFYDDPAINCHC